MSFPNLALSEQSSHDGDQHVLGESAEEVHMFQEGYPVFGTWSPHFVRPHLVCSTFFTNVLDLVVFVLVFQA